MNVSEWYEIIVLWVSEIDIIMHSRSDLLNSKFKENKQNKTTSCHVVHVITSRRSCCQLKLTNTNSPQTKIIHTKTIQTWNPWWSICNWRSLSSKNDPIMSAYSSQTKNSVGSLKLVTQLLNSMGGGLFPNIGTAVPSITSCNQPKNLITINKFLLYPYNIYTRYLIYI